MDDCDVAQRVTDTLLNAAITNANRERYAGTSRETCLECGELIPKARREAVPGCELCINCQRELEAMR